MRKIRSLAVDVLQIITVIFVMVQLLNGVLVAACVGTIILYLEEGIR